MAKKYLIETFGCQMNFHDSERMAGLLDQAGYEATSEDASACETPPDMVLKDLSVFAEKLQEARSP